MWPGYVAVADVFEGGLLLQVDVAHRRVFPAYFFKKNKIIFAICCFRVLRTQTVLDVLREFVRRSGAQSVKIQAEKEFLGQSVVTRSALHSV